MADPDLTLERDESPGGTVAPVANPDPSTRRLLLWLLPLVLAVHLLALYLPGTPGVPEPLYVDKVVHALLFAVPVWLLGRLTGRIWLVAGLFAAHAAISELMQYWVVPFRNGGVFDALADLVGVGLGLGHLLRSRVQT